jgi:nucleotide-binding universal stress UspA family protein
MDEMAITDTQGQRRIVVGVDGSDVSLRALQWAVVQAELTGASLDIVAAWEWPNGLGWSTIPEGFNPQSDAQESLRPVIEDLRGTHPDLSLTEKVIEGPPAQVLVNESRGADLLVVGSRGHGEFVGMLIGSTSEHCVSSAWCPVVVFREEKKSSS